MKWRRWSLVSLFHLWGFSPEDSEPVVGMWVIQLWLLSPNRGCWSGWRWINVCESTSISDAALTASTLKAAAVFYCTSITQQMWLQGFLNNMSNLLKDLNCCVLISSVEPTASAKSHQPPSACHVVQISKQLKCWKDFWKYLTSCLWQNPSLLISLVLSLSSWLLTWTSMRCIY